MNSPVQLGIGEFFVYKYSTVNWKIVLDVCSDSDIYHPTP